jgi:hypothetical protein
MDAQTDATQFRVSTNQVEDANWSEFLARLDSEAVITTDDMLLVASKIVRGGDLT